jgi:hypothetical protein
MYNIHSRKPLDHPQRLNLNLERFRCHGRLSKSPTGSTEGGEHEEEAVFPLTNHQNSSSLGPEIR